VITCRLKQAIRSTFHSTMATTFGRTLGKQTLKLDGQEDWIQSSGSIVIAVQCSHKTRMSKRGRQMGPRLCFRRWSSNTNTAQNSEAWQWHICKSSICCEVNHIILRHCNDRIEPQVFAVKPKNFSFVANILKPSVLRTKGDERETIRMMATQIRLIINNATPGHKLQGSGVDNVFVHTWSYKTNWVYVMLSRVKTKRGLFMRKPLSRDLSKYAVPKALLRMLERMRKHTPTYWSDEQYNELFGSN